MKQFKCSRNTRKFSVRQLAAGVVVASVIGLGSTVVNADSWGGHGHSQWGSKGTMMGQGMMAMGGKGHGGMRQGMMRHGPSIQSGQFIEGRLAFLKAELGITESQKQAWGKFSGFVRAQAETLKSERQQRQAKWKNKTHSNAVAPKTMDQAKKFPLEYMQKRIAHMQERSTRMQARLDAILNLYAALTPEQQVKANNLLGRHLM